MTGPRPAHRFTRRQLLAGVGSGLAIVTLNACGSSDDDTTASPTRSATVTPSAPPTPSPTPALTPSPTPAPTLEQKVAQMISVGFTGATVDEATTITGPISEGRLGNIFIFEGTGNVQSPEQLAALTSGLQSLAPLPLFIATDEEGGQVARLDERHGFPPTLSAAYLGSANDLGLTRQSAGAMAATLAAAGINLNLAPVADVNVNPENPIIGKYDRSFSADPQIVAEQVLAFVKAHHEQGILTTLKHFPGHGSSTTDSHAGFTDVTATWTDAELIPFQAVIDAGEADAVLTGHLFNANLDPDYPATLSQATVTGLLREQMGFDGVILTDGMQMGAITQFYGFAEAIELAINAGCDIISLAGPLQDGQPSADAAAGAIIAAVQAGRISEQRIDESCARVLALKSRLA